MLWQWRRFASSLIWTHLPQLLGQRVYSSATTRKQHEPLRVLFCGADEFSIYSLRALHALQKRRSEKIASIDVVCRPDKRKGRGLKHVNEVPIKPVANELGLRLHQLDTFTGWSPPDPIDLIVAVSFGLLVPARLLRGATYGGLNVHPSLLPELRGAAPIQHALLKRFETTGVTLQTMHPTRFDHGMILEQQEIKVPVGCRYKSMVERLGPIGAVMLAKGIEHSIFVPPLIKRPGSGRAPSQAPKITTEDRYIDWQTWTADEIMLRDRVLGRLWDEVTYNRCHSLSLNSLRRTTFLGPWKIVEAQDDQVRVPMEKRLRPGCPVAVWQTKGKWDNFAICTVDDKLIAPTEALAKGEPGAGLLRKLAREIAQP